MSVYQLLVINSVALNITGQFVSLDERTLGMGCIPLAINISYQCTVDGGILTLWIGSAFTCPTVSITLLHSLFTQTGGVSDSCSNLTAVSVGVSGTEYTSRLTLTATTELNGKRYTVCNEYFLIVMKALKEKAGSKGRNCIILLIIQPVL